MPPKTAKTGQQPPKATTQTKAATTDDSDKAIGNHDANASRPSNTEILNAIRSLKQDFGQQFASMLEAINSFRGDLSSPSKRRRETEEQTEDVTTLQ